MLGNRWGGGLFGKGSRRRTFLKATSEVRPDVKKMGLDHVAHLKADALKFEMHIF